MSGFGTWLRSKLTPAPNKTAASKGRAINSWMDDPAYACTLTLPYGQMPQEDVDRTFLQLTEWANKGKQAGTIPPKRRNLTVRITAYPGTPQQVPDGLQFTGISLELAKWITVSFPAIRELTLHAWRRDIPEQLADAIGRVLLAPTNGWCHQLTKLHFECTPAEVAWAALHRFEEFTALKDLSIRCSEALCPAPTASNDDGDGALAEGPRLSLMLPYLMQLTCFHLDTDDYFSAIWYSLHTFVAPPTLKQKLLLGICVGKEELADTITDLSKSANSLAARIEKIWVELSPLKPLDRLYDLVDVLPNLRILWLDTKVLSLLTIMDALEPLSHIQDLELCLGNQAQLPKYGAVIDKQFILSKRITKAYLYFEKLKHRSIKQGLLGQLFPRATPIKVDYSKCATCNLEKTGYKEGCWNKIVKD